MGSVGDGLAVINKQIAQEDPRGKTGCLDGSMQLFYVTTVQPKRF